MSWRDRDYYRQPPPSCGPNPLSLGLPKPTRLTIYLMVINLGIFVLEALGAKDRLEDGFALVGFGGPAMLLQPWRLISYQFLHGNPSHLFWNMLGLYFFGPPIERYWGPVRFVLFYLFGGVMGGVVFLILSAATPIPSILIGASGAVLALVAACAVLFPRMIIFLLVFPVPIRLAAILIATLSVLYVLWDRSLSEACHLGGMAAGFVLTVSRPLWEHLVFQRRRLRYEALLERETDDQKRVDQILDKVHQRGIQSLTWGEKRTLRQITRRQRQRDELRKHR